MATRPEMDKKPMLAEPRKRLQKLRKFAGKTPKVLRTILKFALLLVVVFITPLLMERGTMTETFHSGVFFALLLTLTCFGIAASTRKLKHFPKVSAWLWMCFGIFGAISTLTLLDYQTPGPVGTAMLYVELFIALVILSACIRAALVDGESDELSWFYRVAFTLTLVNTTNLSKWFGYGSMQSYGHAMDNLAYWLLLISIVMLGRTILREYVTASNITLEETDKEPQPELEANLPAETDTETTREIPRVTGDNMPGWPTTEPQEGTAPVR